MSTKWDQAQLVLGLANDLGKSGITAVAVAPGFMRTEAILEGFGVTETNWRNAPSHPQAGAMGWGGSETPCFVGRAVAAVAADPDVARKYGGIYTTRVLSEEYGFHDVNGIRPDYIVLDAAIEEAKKTFSRRRWTQAASRAWTGSWPPKWRWRHELASRSIAHVSDRQDKIGTAAGERRAGAVGAELTQVRCGSARNVESSANVAAT